MTARRPYTEKQRAAIARAIAAQRAGNPWIIATGSGDRVTLASLHTRGTFERETRRAGRNPADNAYRYRLAPALAAELARRDAAK